MKKVAIPSHVSKAEKYMKEYDGNKSATIRAMFSDGVAKMDISRAMKIRPQFVHNVISAEAIKNS